MRDCNRVGEMGGDSEGGCCKGPLPDGTSGLVALKRVKERGDLGR